MKNINRLEMKMKFLLATLLATFFVVLSCSEDLLDKSDPGSGTMEGFFNSEETLLMGVSGVYEALWPSGDWQTGGAGVWGDNFVYHIYEMDDLTEYSSGGGLGGYSAVARGTVNSISGGGISGRWNKGYAAMSRINNMLEVMPTVEGISSDAIGAIEGELRFLRAWIYFEMTKAYGDLPLLTSVLSAEEIQQVSRSPVSEIYTQIIADLDWCKSNLPDDSFKGDFGRPTKATAMTLLGKVYLQQKDYTNAISNLQQVISLEGTKVGLHSDFKAVKNGGAEQSNEIIFSLQATNDNEGHTEYYSGGFGQGHTQPWGGEHHGWHGYRIAENIIDEFSALEGQTPSGRYDWQKKDHRLIGSFRLPGDTFRGSVIIEDDFVLFGSKNSEAPGVALAYMRLGVLDEGNDQSTWTSPVDLNILRYADVLLMYAEAKNESSGPDASVYSAVNKIRQRAGIGDASVGMSQTDMRAEIRLQRKLEFIGEASRYWDLIRYGTDVEVINSNPIAAQQGGNNYKGGYWPIPQAAVDSSPNIDQTPGY